MAFMQRSKLDVLDLSTDTSSPLNPRFIRGFFI